MREATVLRGDFDKIARDAHTEHGIFDVASRRDIELDAVSGTGARDLVAEVTVFAIEGQFSDLTHLGVAWVARTHNPSLLVLFP